jgi:effector-binding domain-containing protein
MSMNRIAQLMEPAEVQVAPVLAASVERRVGSDRAEVGRAIGSAFAAVMSGLRSMSVAPAGPPRAIYTVANTDETRFIAAVPVAVRPQATEPQPLEIGVLDGGRFLRFEHLGPYRTILARYEEITAWLIENGLMRSRTDWDRFMPMWEECLNDPETTPPNQLLTYIYLPIR